MRVIAVALSHEGWMKFLKMAEGQMLSFENGIHKSKVGGEDLGLTGTGNVSVVFLVAP